MTSLLYGAHEYLAISMTIVPVVLIFIGLMLRRVPHIQEWTIPLALWSIGIAVGMLFDEGPELKRVIANGFIQGSIATGTALLYWKGVRELLRDE